MPQHTKRGRNVKGAKNNVPFKVQGTEYARIVKVLDGCKFTSLVEGHHEILTSLRGNMRNRGRVCVGDTVLVSRRDFQKTPHLDILWKYDEISTERLTKQGHLDHLKDITDITADDVVFEYGSSDSNEELVNIDDI